MIEREQAVSENLGLVRACAARFSGRGAEYDDLYQAGCVGLIKAVDGFDPARGFCFSTYAVPLILGEMRRLFRDGGSMRVSRTIRERATKIGRERERLIEVLHREPTVSELAQAIGEGIEETAQAMGASLPTLSLTRSGEDEAGEIDLPVDGPEEKVTDRLALMQVLGELSGQDRALIVLRYLKSQTQQKTAEQLGMTQVQVSRREREILKKMRLRLTG